MGVRFVFGDYELHPMTRTLTCRGVAQNVEPRVFDVIVLLVTHRDRVVTKQELLASVWGTRVVVTEGVIARTVMKARRLLGDAAEQPTTIRTVPRVGYRFAAPVNDVANPRTATLGRDDASGPGRVAILPFQDKTASPDLGWIDFGLMSMTADALAMQDGDSSVVPAADLLSVVGAGNPLADLASLARKLTSALGTVDVVQATVLRDERGTLVLRYVGAGPSLASLAGELRGSDPVELCRQMAAAIRAARAAGTGPSGAASPPTDEGGRNMRFARTARARALQAIHARQWRTADKLLRVALDLVPDDPAMQLERARCLAEQRDPDAVALLERALQLARSTANATLELRALQLLANHRRVTGYFAEAERHLLAALSIAEQLGDRETELKLLLAIADSFVDEGRLQAGSRQLERANRLAQSLGNQVAMARLLDTRARIAALSADPEAVLATHREAAALSARYGLHGSALSSPS